MAQDWITTAEAVDDQRVIILNTYGELTRVGKDESARSGGATGRSAERVCWPTSAKLKKSGAKRGPKTRDLTSVV